MRFMNAHISMSTLEHKRDFLIVRTGPHVLGAGWNKKQKTPKNQNMMCNNIFTIESAIDFIWIF